MSGLDLNDLIHNPSPRCACMLVLDTSGSMDGAPIAELNDGLRRLLAALKEDEVASFSVELGIVTTGSGVARQELALTGVNALDSLPQLGASGGTPLGEAVKLALDALEVRKEQYRSTGVPYFQPWLIIISDGSPGDSWTSVAERSHGMSSHRKLVCLPVGVSGADMGVLAAFSSKGAKPLEGLKFAEFFEWLSASMGRVSASNSTAATVQLPSTDPWSCA